MAGPPAYPTLAGYSILHRTKIQLCLGFMESRCTAGVKICRVLVYVMRKSGRRTGKPLLKPLRLNISENRPRLGMR